MSSYYTINIMGLINTIQYYNSGGNTFDYTTSGLVKANILDVALNGRGRLGVDAVYGNPLVGSYSYQYHWVSVSDLTYLMFNIISSNTFSTYQTITIQIFDPVRVGFTYTMSLGFNSISYEPVAGDTTADVIANLVGGINDIMWTPSVSVISSGTNTFTIQINNTTSMFNLSSTIPDLFGSGNYVEWKNRYYFVGPQEWSLISMPAIPSVGPNADVSGNLLFDYGIQNGILTLPDLIPGYINMQLYNDNSNYTTSPITPLTLTPAQLLLEDYQYYFDEANQIIHFGDWIYSTNYVKILYK